MVYSKEEQISALRKIEEENPDLKAAIVNYGEGAGVRVGNKILSVKDTDAGEYIKAYLEQMLSIKLRGQPESVAATLNSQHEKNLAQLGEVKKLGITDKSVFVDAHRPTSAVATVVESAKSAASSAASSVYGNVVKPVVDSLSNTVKPVIEKAKAFKRDHINPIIGAVSDEPLVKGEHSDRVGEVQTELHELGKYEFKHGEEKTTGKADRIFGADTESGIKSTQKEAGLTETGIADGKTLAAIDVKVAEKHLKDYMANDGKLDAKEKEQFVTDLRRINKDMQNLSGENVDKVAKLGQDLRDKIKDYKIVAAAGDAEFATQLTGLQASVNTAKATTIAK